MALYIYAKSSPVAAKEKAGFGWLPVFSAGLGFFIIGLLAGSFMIYQWRAEAYFRAEELPIAGEGEVLSVQASNADYLQPAAWFTSPPNLPVRQSKITHYNLSISDLRINQAVVEIRGTNLDKSMIHYPGTVLPGQTGNAVVFCHSVLPQFFNPKSYRTICSTLHTLDLGAQIEIYFDGVKYSYQVIKMWEVEPDEVSVLSQPDEGEYLSVITCTPPGTYLRRLVVKARLVS
ncbi:sortase [Patescibacteria group bacterium]|nr:sortase [Patescibacteria group bacterium]